MEAVALSSCGGWHPSSLFHSRIHRRRPTSTKTLITIPKPAIVAANDNSNGPRASDGSRQRGRRSSPVDKFLPLLYARIREVEAEEKLAHGSDRAMVADGLVDHQPPTETDEWPEWERRYYLTGNYYRNVFAAVEAVQAVLMDSKPGVVIGALALVLLGLVMTGVAVSASLAGALLLLPQQ